MKIITIIGTRPEIIRLSCIIPLLDKYTKNIIVHTGQNFDYELDKIFLNLNLDNQITIYRHEDLWFTIINVQAE